MEELLERGAAVITGAAGGIGRAIALRLSDAGWGVMLIGRRRAELDALAQQIESRRGRVLVQVADVRDYQALVSAVNVSVDAFGRIDIVVANAAIADRAAFQDGDPSVWADVITTNVLGVMYTIRAGLEHMRAAQAGQIVIVSSLAGRRTLTGQPAYVVGKFATVALGDLLRKELAGTGVRVFVLEPGLVDTPLSRQHKGPHAADVQPLDPDDCARVVEYVVRQPANCAINEVALRPARQVL